LSKAHHFSEFPEILTINSLNFTWLLQIIFEGKVKELEEAHASREAAKASHIAQVIVVMMF
jgi:hypothetical protein